MTHIQSIQLIHPRSDNQTSQKDQLYVVHPGEGNVMFNATLNPSLLNKICLNQRPVVFKKPPGFKTTNSGSQSRSH